MILIWSFGNPLNTVTYVVELNKRNKIFLSVSKYNSDTWDSFQSHQPSIWYFCLLSGSQLQQYRPHWNHLQMPILLSLSAEILYSSRQHLKIKKNILFLFVSCNLVLFEICIKHHMVYFSYIRNACIVFLLPLWFYYLLLGSGDKKDEVIHLL